MEENLKTKFSTISSKNNCKRYSRFTSLGAGFAKGFNRNSRDLLRRSVFQEGDDNWIDVLLTITKQYFNRNHSSTKLTPIEASFKMNEGYVYQNLLYKRKK